MASDFKYSIDTSALVHAYQRSYPPDILPDLWDKRLDELIEAGRLFAAYTNAHKSEPMRPVSPSDGRDAVGIVDQLVPSLATEGDDVVVAFEDAV